MKYVASLTVALLAAGQTVAVKISVSTCLRNKGVPARYPGDSSYAELAEPFNLRLQYKPAVIVLPNTNKHVQEAVICASQCGLKVQAKSGGHSYASFSSGGKGGSMMVDLQPLQNIQLNKKTNIVKVGGGVRLGNLAQGVWDQGKRAISHGTCPGVGIGGHFTHGGYGHTSRNWGIALDHIVEADVVLANGELVKANKDQNKDIFWAIRGAAESFGIVTNFYLRTQAAPKSVTYFQFQWADQTLLGDKKRFTDAFLHIQEFSRNSSVVDNRISYGINTNGVNSYNLGGTFFGTVDEFNTKIKPEFLRGITAPTKVVVERYGWIPYLTLMSDKTDIREPLTGYDEHDTFFAKSITVPESKGLTATTLNNLYDYLKKGAPYDYFIIINLYGGPGSAINTKDTNFAAYSERDSLFVFQNYGIKPTTLDFINGINDVIIKSQRDTEFGAYLNYVDPTYSAAEAHELYYGEELYCRLAALKKKVDPKSVFWFPQAIGA